MDREVGALSASPARTPLPPPLALAAGPRASAAHDGTPLWSLPPMLTALERDSGATFSLCQMLTLQELSALHTTSSSWRRWIDALPAGPGLDAPPLALKPAAVLRMEPGAWTSRQIRSLTLLSHDADSKWNSSLEEEYATMRHLPHACPRLRSLRLQLPDWPEDAGPLLECLETLAELLQTFDLFLAEGAVPSPALHRLIQTLGRLQRLQVLKLTNDFPPEEEEPVDWTPLTTLSELHSLSLYYVFPFTKFDYAEPALRTLAACRQLTFLSMASGSHSDWDALQAFLSARPADAAPIQELDLEQAEMYESEWKIIKPIASLTRLNPFVLWRHEQLWAELPRALPQLRSLHITTVPPRTGCTVWLPAVTQCPQLTDLHVNGQNLTAAQLQELVDALPLLSTLRLDYCTLESLAPLASAHALTSLTIVGCHSEQPRIAGAESERPKPKAPTDWRPLLPPLPALRRLVIKQSTKYDPPVCDDTEESTARRAALLSRMPLLAAVNYTEKFKD